MASDKETDLPTDTAGYRVGCTRLKTITACRNLNIDFSSRNKEDDKNIKQGNLSLSRSMSFASLRTGPKRRAGYESDTQVGHRHQ